jgi:hypothetical protein
MLTDDDGASCRRSFDDNCAICEKLPGTA